jgi:uncharacterized protein (TIGR02569 family)
VTSIEVPPAVVLKAFGVTAAPVALDGGKGGTWRAGEVVLKPVEFALESLWRAEVLGELPASELFRVARPLRAIDGSWLVDGWEASRYVAGKEDVNRPDDVLRAGVAFHAAIAELTRPEFLDVRDEAWSHGDRVAWEELPVQVGASAEELLTPLLQVRRPVDLVAQAVHGDLLGNVLFADGLPPAIIDWPAYWRPPSWALAVAVADALCWYDATPELVDRWVHLPEWGQMLVRALIYRLVTDDAVLGSARWPDRHIDAYRPAIEAAIRCAERG